MHTHVGDDGVHAISASTVSIGKVGNTDRIGSTADTVNIVRPADHSHIENISLCHGSWIVLSQE